MKVYIYALVDPRTSAAHYVGRTRGSLENRLRSHMLEARRSNRRTPKHDWMRELWDSGLEPVLKLLEETDDEHADAIEYRTIQELLTGGSPLTNRVHNDRERTEAPLCWYCEKPMVSTMPVRIAPQASKKGAAKQGVRLHPVCAATVMGQIADGLAYLLR